MGDFSKNHSASNYSHPSGGWYWIDGDNGALSTPLENSGYEVFTVSDTTINPGDGFSTTSYTITQSDVDSGFVINTVSATGSSPGRTNDSLQTLVMITTMVMAIPLMTRRWSPSPLPIT